MGASKSKGGEVAIDGSEDISIASSGVRRRQSFTSLNDLDANSKDAAGENGMRRARSSLSIPRRLSYSGKRNSQKRAQTMPKDIEEIVKVRKRILREGNTLKAWVDVNKLPIFQELKYAIEFRFCPTFDDSEPQDKVQFSNNNRTIVYTGRGYSTTCMRTPFGKGLRNGRHAWLLHVDTSRVVGWMHIGIVNEERKETGCKTIWDGNPHPFRKGEMSRSSNGNFNSGVRDTQVQVMQFAGGYTSGDTVGVKLDFDAGTIQWLRNGEDYGEPAQLQNDVVYPSVSLDSPGEGVTLAFYAGSPGI